MNQSLSDRILFGMWPAPLAAFLLILCGLLLSSCGDDYASYEKPSGPETEWHRCMRQSSPIGRSFKCQDLR